MRRAVVPLAFALRAAMPLTAAILTEHVGADDCPMPPVTPAETPARVPAGLVSELLEWIGQATDYDVAEALADPRSSPSARRARSSPTRIRRCASGTTSGGVTRERWLAARGGDPEFDWLQTYMVSRCPSDVHP